MAIPSLKRKLGLHHAATCTFNPASWIYTPYLIRRGSSAVILPPALLSCPSKTIYTASRLPWDKCPSHPFSFVFRPSPSNLTGRSDRAVDHGLFGPFIIPCCGAVVETVCWSPNDVQACNSRSLDCCHLRYFVRSSTCSVRTSGSRGTDFVACYLLYTAAAKAGLDKSGRAVNRHPEMAMRPSLFS